MEFMKYVYVDHEVIYLFLNFFDLCTRFLFKLHIDGLGKLKRRDLILMHKQTRRRGVQMLWSNIKVSKVLEINKFLKLCH